MIHSSQAQARNYKLCFSVARITPLTQVGRTTPSTTICYSTPLFPALLVVHPSPALAKAYLCRRSCHLHSKLKGPVLECSSLLHFCSSPSPPSLSITHSPYLLACEARVREHANLLQHEGPVARHPPLLKRPEQAVAHGANALSHAPQLVLRQGVEGVEGRVNSLCVGRFV